MVGLGEEEPAFHEQAKVLHDKGGQQQHRGFHGHPASQQADRQGEDQYEKHPFHLAQQSGGLAVEELPRIEGAAHGTLGLLHDARMLHADCGSHARFRLEAGVAQQRSGAADKGEQIADRQLQARWETLLAVKALRRDPRVEYAEPNYRVRALATPAATPFS